MMTKPPIQPQDKYVLRLPDGLRDRIKAYAEKHGRSMNTEIVRVLENEFPEPWPLQDRLGEIFTRIEILKSGISDPTVDRILIELNETVVGIISGRVTGLTDDQRAAIEERWQYWQENAVDDGPELDTEEVQMRSSVGRTSKVIHSTEGDSE